jgi:hypothetical protein
MYGPGDAITPTDEASVLEAPTATTEPAQRTYRRLRMGGLTMTEAGNLTARVKGLRAVPGGWTVEEIEQLLFVRELVRQGRMGS